MSRSQRLVVLIAVLASAVAFLDGTVVTVALPSISADLGGGLVAQQWVVNAYYLTLGALMLVAGSMSDAYGRITVLRCGLVGFLVTSVVIASAPSIGVLIAARAAQGVAGALLIPSSLALITARFDEESRGRAIGIWTGATAGAMIVGPLIGGALVDLASWRWAFLINVPIILVTLWLVHRLGERDERKPGVRIDLLGCALCVVGLGGIVFAFTEGPRLGWGSPAIVGALVGGIAAFSGFVLWQRSAAQPMMPLSLFRVRDFWAGNLATAFVYAALSLNGFVVGVYLQQGAGLSATEAGLATLPMTIIMLVGSSRVGALAGRFGDRIFMTVGPLLMAVGALVLLTVRDDFDYWTQVLPAVLVAGVGLTMTVTPLTSAVLGAVDTEHSGIASAVNNAISRVAGLLVVAVLGVIVGGSLDLEGFHRAAVVTAALVAAGGLVSWLGIRATSPVTDRVDD